MTISAIVATDINGLIGKGNTLPWHLPADLQYFKYITSGKAIIMGRKTFESLGRPLPNRKNIVISRTKVQDDRIETYPSLEEALAHHSDCFIIGGAQIYRYALENNLIDELYVTLIDNDFGEGDAYFHYDKTKWQITNSIYNEKDDKNIYNYTFMTLKK
jgi:dihydrofolate reductase